MRDDPSLVAKYPNLKPFIDELPYAHYETIAPGINEANALITTALNEALTGKKTPEAGARRREGQGRQDPQAEPGQVR